MLFLQIQSSIILKTSIPEPLTNGRSLVLFILSYVRSYGQLQSQHPHMVSALLALQSPGSNTLFLRFLITFSPKLLTFLPTEIQKFWMSNTTARFERELPRPLTFVFTLCVFVLTSQSRVGGQVSRNFGCQNAITACFHNVFLCPLHKFCALVPFCPKFD